jgi:hypothetical protein
MRLSETFQALRRHLNCCQLDIFTSLTCYISGFSSWVTWSTRTNIFLTSRTAVGIRTVAGIRDSCVALSAFLRLEAQMHTLRHGSFDMSYILTSNTVSVTRRWILRCNAHHGYRTFLRVFGRFPVRIPMRTAAVQTFISRLSSVFNEIRSDSHSRGILQICRLSLMWEAPTHIYPIHHSLISPANTKEFTEFTQNRCMHYTKKDRGKLWYNSRKYNSYLWTIHSVKISSFPLL